LNEQAPQGEQLVRRLTDEVLNAQAIERLEEFLAEDYVDHAAGLSGDAAIGALRRGFESWWSSFSDHNIEITHLVVAGDLVSYRSVCRCTHSGPYAGIPATGKEIVFEAHELYRVRDGRLAEHWEVWDEASVLRQLGALRDES
jgi:steroid delta-isomerase-like uncharacterized protein